MLKPPVQFLGDNTTPGPELPDGAHGEVDKDWRPWYRFVCVKASGSCIELQTGDWILYSEDGEAYPLPDKFMKALESLFTGVPL